MKRLALLAVVAVAACKDVPAWESYDNTALLHAALAPNAFLVTVAPDMTSENSKTTSHDLQGRVRVAPLAAGFAAVLAPSREEISWNDETRRLGLVRAVAAGMVHTRDEPGARTTLVGFGDEAVIVVCGYDVLTPFTRLMLTDVDDGFVDLSGNVGGCAPYLAGRAANPDEAIVDMQGALLMWKLDRATRTLTADPYSPTPATIPAFASTVFLDEPVAGELAFVTLDAGQLAYQRGASTTTASGIDGLDGPVHVTRGADGALRVDTSTGLWRWDVDSAGVPTKLADSPAAPGADAWTMAGTNGGAYAWTAGPNPLNPAELMPTAASVRVVQGDVFTTFEPNPTPCCDEAACRNTAESYVIGGYDDGTLRMAFYDLWTWVGTNQHAMVVAGAPLACTD